MENSVTEHYPWVKFLLHGEPYCITSRNVSSMSPIAEIAPLPGREAWFRGLARVGGGLVPVVDLRALLGLPDLQTDLDAFAQMKEKHVDWVGELSRSARENLPFEMTRDPHRCSFGVWYDSYHSSNSMIDFILDEIRDPHIALHRCAERIDAARAKGDEEEVGRILAEAEALCDNKILPLLDQLIEVYNDAHKGMVLTLEEEDGGKRVGIVADEVTGLEDFAEQKGVGALAGFGASGYVRDICIGEDHRIYLEIDGGRILALLEDMEQIKQ